MTTQGTSSPSLTEESPRIERILDLIAPKLERVEEALQQKFVSDVRTVRDVGDHVLAGGGKRLRPSLLLLVSDMLGYRGENDVKFAAVVELIHTATLVHDDIIDQAAVRRGRTSINYRWGNHLTVLIGDYLYTHSMDLALEVGNLDVLRLLSRATIRMTEGEILGLEKSGRLDLTLDEYFDIVGRKTAELFGASCRIPGYLVDLPESSGNALFSYGFNLGVCFQLIDDLLDYTSSTEALGKPALSDLKEGKLTLPLLLALPHATDTEKRLIERVVNDHAFGSTRPPEVMAIVNRYGALERSREIAAEYADRARASLMEFKPSPSRDALEFAVDFVTSRNR